MARIRSIHPSLCTDEIYMSMSMPTKAAWPLLWMECDDQGAFEWKPIVLKARLFPADSIDIAATLQELQTLGAVMQVEIDGKACGIIRNFCKYQRPKKPVHRFKLTDEMRTFVGVKRVGAEPVPNRSSTGSELSPQRKDEGGSKEDEGSKKDSRTVAKATRPANDLFEKFWKSYPKRKGANPKTPAQKLFDAAVKGGVDPPVIFGAIEAGVGFDKDQIATQFIPQAVKWLRDKRWEEFTPPDAKTKEDRDKWMSDRGYVWSDERWQKREKTAAA